MKTRTHFEQRRQRLCPLQRKTDLSSAMSLNKPVNDEANNKKPVGVRMGLRIQKRYIILFKMASFSSKIIREGQKQEIVIHTHGEKNQATETALKGPRWKT